MVPLRVMVYSDQSLANTAVSVPAPPSSMSLPPPPSSTLASASPVRLSSWDEPVRFSISASTSPAASPPLAVPSSKLTVTPAAEPA